MKTKKKLKRRRVPTSTAESIFFLIYINNMEEVMFLVLPTTESCNVIVYIYGSAVELCVLFALFTAMYLHLREDTNNLFIR